MGTLSATIGGNSVNIEETSFAMSPAIGQRSTCQFSVKDDTGLQHYTNNQPVTVTDSVFGLQFAGYIDKPDEDKLIPNATIITAATVKDNHYLADKLLVDRDWQNMQAGDVATEMLSRYLAGEGVTAGYAFRRTTTQTDWSTGTLSGVSSTSNIGDGDLELPPAGTNVSWTDNTTAEFAAGTLANVDARNNQLNLHAYNVIKLNGTCAISGNNAFLYWKIWSGSQVIASGQTFQYDVWISSTSAAQQAAVDFVCTDGTTMRDFNSQGVVDQYGIKAHPSADLSDFATDQWYHRTIDVTALAGKTIAFVQLSFESDSVGNYQAYFRNIRYVDVGGVTVLTTFYDSTTHPYDPQNAALNQNIQVSNNGYTSVQIQQVTAYDQTGNRISPAISIDAAKVVNSSLVTWTSLIPSGVTPASQVSGSSAPLAPAGTSITILTSIDSQVTFQPATYNAPIPDLSPGFNIAGRNLFTQIQFAITGTTPEITPAISALTTNVTTAYIAGTVNSLTSFDTTANFNTGTNVNTLNWAYVPDDTILGTPNGNVTLTGMFFNFLAAAGANGTANLQMFGTASPAKTNFKHQVKLTTGTGTDVKARFLSYGPAGSDSFQNFTAQVLVQVPALAVGNAGIVYRTTGWVNGNDTYAYYAGLTTAGPILYRATNGGASTSTLIANPAVTLTAGNFYTLKIIINGNNHQVFIDDVLYINATDATYPAAGNLGLRLYNNSGSTQSILFGSFGVVNTLSGATWISPAVSLNALGTIGQSAIFWNSIVPTGGSLICESSINAGVSWQAVAQGGQIGNAPPGTNVVGKSVQLRFTFMTPNASVTPVLQAVTIWATSQVTASGNRVSTALALANVGRAGSAVLYWTANTPPNTTLGMDASPDGTTWTDVTALAGQPLPAALIKQQPAPFLDFYGSITDWIDQDIGAVGIAGSAALATPTWTIKGSGADIFGTADAFHFNYQLVSGNVILTTRVATEQNTDVSAKAGIMARQDTTAGSVFYHAFFEPSGTVNVEYRSTAGGGSTSAASAAQAIPEYLKIQNTGTSWSAYTSPDGITWTLITGSTQTLANLSTSSFLVGLTVCAHNNSLLNTSTFDSVTISGTGALTDYLSTFFTGGAVATWTFDKANKQLIGNQASGVNGVLQYTGFTTFADMFVEADFNYSDDGGIVARMVDASNAYFLSIHDASASSNANTLILRKIVAGTVTTIAGPTAISFPRGDYHRFRLDIQGTTIKSLMDGAQIHSVTDAGVSAAGKAGLLAGQTASNKVQVLSLRVQPYGDDVTAKNLYTRARLSTTDPTVTPQVLDQVLSVHNANIQQGALIASTAYATPIGQQVATVAAGLDDLANKSNGFIWWIGNNATDGNKQFYFMQRQARPAPFYLFTAPITGNIKAANHPKVSRPDMLYRNRMVVDGGIDTTTITGEQKPGDGFSRSWTLSYPVQSITSIVVSGNAKTVGIQGVDTGKDFYYTVGSSTVSQDASETPFAKTDTIVFNYVGQFQVRVQRDNVNGSGIYAGTIGQTQMAAIDGTSGIIAAYESAPNLNKVATTQLADSRLIQYGIAGVNAITIEFDTTQFGLQPGMLAGINMPEHGIVNTHFLLTAINVTTQTLADGTVLYWFKVSATTGPVLGDWSVFFNKMLPAK